MQFNFKYSRLSLLVAGVALAGCSTMATHDTATNNGKAVELTILHTNDNHGHFWRKVDWNELVAV